MNPITWIEVPVTNMDRAMAFYNHVFSWELKPMAVGDLVMAWFPVGEGYGSGGSLVQHESYVPGSEGAVIYFACDEVSAAIERVKDLGGTVIQEKKQISEEHGYMGLIFDSEGNRIALHSRE